MEKIFNICVTLVEINPVQLISFEQPQMRTSSAKYVRSLVNSGQNSNSLFPAQFSWVYLCVCTSWLAAGRNEILLLVRSNLQVFVLYGWWLAWGVEHLREIEICNIVLIFLPLGWVSNENSSPSLWHLLQFCTSWLAAGGGVVQPTADRRRRRELGSVSW